MNIDPAKIEVLILHPWGDLNITLEEWMEQGPGPRRLLRPSAACDIETKEPLPIKVVPLRYRNTRWSRFLIRIGLLDDPWASPS